MKRLTTLLIALAALPLAVTAQDYKTMMNDMNVNFYDVCEAAEAYFEVHGKGKGSGWKGYQRWRYANEYKYYPSGDRSNVDPYFVKHAYEEFLRNTPQARSSFPNGWIDRGPYDANNITSHYAPGIGRVEHFWVDASNPNTIYLGSRSGGFWATNDGGQNWFNSTDYMVASGCNTITASPTNSDSVLVNIQNASNQASHGIHRSVDGGMTWTITNFIPDNLGWGGFGDNTRVYRVAYHPTIPDLIFVGTSKGLYRSDDNLSTWTQQYPNGDITRIQFHPTDPNIVYIYDNDGSATNDDAILISTDAGQSFVNSNTAVGNNGAHLFISVSPDCPNCIFVGSSNGVWKSTDLGQNFTFMMNPPSACGGYAVSDVDTTHMVYGYVDLEASNDGGQSFQQRTWWANGSPDSTYIHADMRWAQCVNGVFYVATDGYLAKSADNGLSWERISDGTGIRESYAAGLSQSNSEVWMSGSQDNGTSIHLETGWIEWNGGDGMEAIVQTLNDSWMIGSWQYGTRNRTKDRGLTWHGVGTPQDGYWVAPMFFDPNQHMRVYHFSDSTFVSDAFGTGWTYLGSPQMGNMTRATIAENNSNRIIVTAGGNIRLSQDAGQTYADISGLSLPNHWIQDVVFDPNDDNTIVVVFARYQNDGEKVFISHNSGLTWQNITYNLGDIPCRSVIVDHTDASNIYVGTEIGVYTMPMGGTTWTPYKTNLPNVSINELEIQYATNTLRAITWGRGIWDYTLVGRNDHPNILTTTITDPPTESTPAAGDDQYVTSVISYPNALSSVYLQWSTGAPTFDSTIVMNNTVDSTWVSAAPIPAYAEGTDMYFKVFAVGAAGDTTETYKYHYRIQQGCVSNGNMTWQTSVTLVDFEDINRASGKTQPYTDYRSTDSTTVQLTETYPITVNVNTDGPYTLHTRVWIDWNQDFDFEDPGEEYDMGTTNNTPDGPTGNSPLMITIPSNASLGKTIMRVATKYNSAPTPCETGYDGEVEDYTIIVDPYCPITYGTLTATACNDYTAPSGMVLSSSGTYTDVIPNVYGCDSVISIDLTVNYDGVETLNETGCYTYALNGQTYTSSGTYTQQLQTVLGCDSTINLNLTINTVDTSVSVNAITLTANASGASYQWMKCGVGLVTGETNQSFTPISNGSYAVIVTENGCSDTSACFPITSVGIDDLLTPEGVTVYPNPSNGAFTLELEAVVDVRITIYNGIGQVVYDQQHAGQQLIPIALEPVPGVYHVQLETSAGTLQRQLVIE